MRVSIVVPTYNRASLLPRCIQSVLEQTYCDFELIIVDDGSTDNTASIVSQFNDPRILYLQQKENMGAQRARNIGIKAAQSELIAFQESDDEWFPENLEKKVDLMRRAPQNIGVIYSQFYKIHKGGEKVLWPPKNIRKLSGNLLEELSRGNFITDQAAVVRKTVFSDVGLFDESLPGMQEWDMWLRVAQKYDFLFIKEPLLITYYTDNSITSHSEWRLRGREIIFNKHSKIFRRYPRILAMHAYTIGNARALRGNIKMARTYLGIAFRIRPWNIKYAGAFFLSSIGSSRLYKTFARIAKHLV